MQKPILEFWSRTRKKLTPDFSHLHPYWQLEIIRYCENGYLEVRERILPLEKPMLILIPPGLLHRFHWGDPPFDSFSLKFRLEYESSFSDVAAIPEAQNRVAAYFGERLTELLDTMNPGPQDQQGRELLEYLLMVLVDAMFGQREQYFDLPDWLKKVDRLVLEQRRNLSVKSAADFFHWTPVQLEYRFRKTAERNPDLKLPASLKCYIDRKMLALIDKYLLYTELSLNQIAEELRFPDRFAFSHFYKRLKGCSPGSISRGTLFGRCGKPEQKSSGKQLRGDPGQLLPSGRLHDSGKRD